MKTRYTLKYDTAEMVVDVDVSPATRSLLEHINNSYDGADERLIECRGLTAHAGLKMLFAQVLSVQVGAGLSTKELIEQFDWDAGLGIEGWPKLDGSSGIQLISCEQYRFRFSDMSIESRPFS